MKNSSTKMEFLLLGISHNPTTQALIFIIFTLIYLFILMGNMLVFVATVSDCNLHTPMYYFLRHLSVLDICYTSVTLPHMLVNLMSEKKTISLSGCAMQMFSYIFLGAVVCYLLAVMSYDRYLAICQPLHYTRLMTKHACFILISGCWVIGLSVSLVQTWLVFSIPFCGSYIINHFFCDVPPLIKLHCPTSNINYVERILTIFLVLITPFLLILASYIFIIVAVLKIAIANGRQKALGTCSSHLLSVVLFYGTATFTYVKSSSGYIDPIDKLLSLMYTVAPAMLNPLIYSLRNKQVKDALRNIVAKSRYFLNV